ncbi:DUF2383 domain-containing protein [Hasllibacter sp. MH4015]|uniref:DUF2383 domain-containing protein n=1 Tax=Hasllibacter sp. MH4015 TaxID=2854029 RepID=UPI001CD220FC|nr:DUF2383 domain-containing protein [Hasllibacter sp. MH4015]
MADTINIPPADTVIDAVETVATDVTDVITGYEVMADRAEDGLKPVVTRLLVLHQSHAATLADSVKALGGQSEDAGSVMGLVHTAVATARDWFDGLDRSAISVIVDGEKRLIESYSDALSRVEGHDEITRLLASQRGDLEAQVIALAR